MSRRITALLLALAMSGVLFATALAEEDTAEQSAQTAQAEAQSETTADNAATKSTAEGAQGETDTAAALVQETTQENEADANVPDLSPVADLTFAQVEERVRNNNLTILALEENIAAVEATDYKELLRDLDDQLDELEDAKDGIEALIGQLQSSVEPPLTSGEESNVDLKLYGQVTVNNLLTKALASATVASLESSIESLEDTIADIRSGKTQKTAQDGIRQMENLEDQVVVGAENLYMTVLELQNTRSALERSLESMDRTIQEMELRYQLGQISALQLQQAKGGRTQIESGIATLESSMDGAVVQLEMMVGADVTGRMRVAEVPEISDALVEAIDYEKEVESAKERSYDLYAARVTLNDAEEDYKEAKKEHGKNTYERKMAEHQWQAAQYTYQAAEQSFEAQFRALCASVKDYHQILKAKETALAIEQADFEAQKLKYEQGSISKNTYLTAQDDLAAARDEVTTAKHNLYTAYRSYEWAINSGVMG